MRTFELICCSNPTMCWCCRWGLRFGPLQFIAHPSVAPCLNDMSPLTCLDTELVSHRVKQEVTVTIELADATEKKKLNVKQEN